MNLCLLSVYVKHSLQRKQRNDATMSTSPDGMGMELSDRPEIYQASRQPCCRDACQISKRYIGIL